MEKHRSSVERYLPVIYAGFAILLTVALLPTALRPPQPPPPTSAEFSPDAPPDDNQEVILSELARGSTATAGSGEVVEVGAEGQGTPVTEQVVELAPRRGTCFGDPPRQTDSLYAPPCAAAWSGNNGGATWPGVTATEVRVAVVRASGTGYEGFVDTWQGNVTDEPEYVRTYRVWQTYFNERFELYGRTLRVVLVNGGANAWQEGSTAREAVRKAHRDYEVFGIITSGAAPPAEDEALQRELVLFGGTGNPIEYFRDNAPYAWSFSPDSNKQRRMATELMCKQLHGKPVSFSGDPLMNGQVRRYGVIAYQDMTHWGGVQGYEEEFARQCGGDYALGQYYNLDDDAANLASIMTRMRAERVTTVVCGCDATAPIVFANSAQNLGYFPEWIMPGTGGMDRNSAAGNYAHRTQWANAIGVTFLEMEGARPGGDDGYRAYKQVDPDGEPDDGLFGQLQQFVAGVQMAGPELTPFTFQDGLQQRWPKRAPDPQWSMGGGYGPGDWTYPDYVALVWWDPAGDRPGSTTAGAYTYVYGGKRFSEGEIPTEPVPFREEGITQPPPDQRM